MASPGKRCLYEVLGLGRDCTADEIRSAYRKLALQRHPDKLVQSGVSEADATASFQELVNAYEVLSDPRERAWYDSHRSQILFSGPTPSGSSTVPDLFSFFSNSVFSGYSDTAKGFYKVYADVFDRIYSNELNFSKKLGLGLGAVKGAPVMGNLQSPYTQVTAFYNYWLGFVTVMDFCWVDQYDAMAGPNRKSRRVMEDENKKLRKKARRDYNDTVRGLAEFVKKRDKRVIDMQVKRSEEMERKRMEEREKRRQLEREKKERAKAYEEPEWSKVEEGDEEVEDGGEIEDEIHEKKKELYCVVCGKKFKSEKQWKNHEQSKKHKEKVAELKEAFGDEESEEEVLSGDGNLGSGDGNGPVVDNDEVDELREQFKDSFGVQERKSGGGDNDDDEARSRDEEEFLDVDNNSGGLKGVGEFFGSGDDEVDILETMVSGHKSRKNVASVHQSKAKNSSTKAHVESDSDEMDFEYNKRKSTRRNRGARRGRGKSTDEEAVRAETAEINNLGEESNGLDDVSLVEESSSQSFSENINGKGDNHLERNDEVPKQFVGKKGVAKKDPNTKLKNPSKGRKQKATSKFSGTLCETCGEDFESRNKLHKHLGDTGHAMLKSQ
ncbi:DNAJ protein JJJ1 homolog [Cornus florida]|uniref:DNAJ protein JJJ1 homolog n=1 Tax=Cornus florida TaxID=4283 RepID=UPI00289BCD1F|nr:DNAJ protein JJJ1 homolog [Cornus florida]